MSYILDALRRSQAERERGQVPGLDARPTAVAAVPSAPPGQRWRRVGLGALALVGAGLMLLWWLRAVLPAAPTLPAVVASAERPAPAVPLPTTLAPATAPVPAPVPAPVQVPAPATLPTVVSAHVPPPAAVVLPAAPAVAQTRPAPGTAAAAAPVPAASAPARTPLAALTPAQRRELPPLVLGGSIWSDSALGRFVIVNGQVVREGETAALGVVVERIEPKAVLLRWRELRLEVPL